MKQEYQFDVFISHSSKDETITLEIYKYLSEHGMRCWVDKYHILPSEQYAISIEDGIKASEKFLLLYSKNVLDSVDILNELELGKRKEMHIFVLDDAPIDAKGFEYYITRTQHLKGYPNYREHLPELLAALQGKPINKDPYAHASSGPNTPKPKKKWGWVVLVIALLMAVLGLGYKYLPVSTAYLRGGMDADTTQLTIDTISDSSAPVVIKQADNHSANPSNPKDVAPKKERPNTQPVVKQQPKQPIDKSYTVNGVTFRMMKVNAGQFAMGADASTDSFAYPEEAPIHSVQLTDFYIGETEVTQALWTAVMGTGLEEHIKGKKAHGLGNDYPMYYVSYDDCVAFVMALNELTGESFRLPTEAEWEYAARERTSTQLYAGANVIGGVAWYEGNSGGTAQPVAQKKANALGVYDMCGNVAEWCMDWFELYPAEASTNPMGPELGELKVFRGGSWADKAIDCRVSCRTAWQPDYRSANIGLRLAL